MYIRHYNSPLIAESPQITKRKDGWANETCGCKANGREFSMDMQAELRGSRGSHLNFKQPEG